MFQTTNQMGSHIRWILSIPHTIRYWSSHRSSVQSYASPWHGFIQCFQGKSTGNSKQLVHTGAKPLWFPMVSYGFLWFPLVSYGMVSYDFLWKANPFWQIQTMFFLSILPAPRSSDPYPLVICYSSLLNMARRNKWLPIKNGDFPCFFVCLPEANAR